MITPDEYLKKYGIDENDIVAYGRIGLTDFISLRDIMQGFLEENKTRRVIAVPYVPPKNELTDLLIIAYEDIWDCIDFKLVKMGKRQTVEDLIKKYKEQ